MAYHFHWQKDDIMKMTLQERAVWLSQIDRINRERRQMNEDELVRQTEYVRNLRAQEQNGLV